MQLRQVFSTCEPDSYQMHRAPSLDSIAVSVFADIFIELTNTVYTVSDGKIQITILILRRGALSTPPPPPLQNVHNFDDISMNIVTLKDH